MFDGWMEGRKEGRARWVYRMLPVENGSEVKFNSLEDRSFVT